MRFILSIFLLLDYTAAFPQRNADFNAIDFNVQYINPASPQILARTLTAPFTTDLQKVRAIFSWIAQHIEYSSGRRNYIKSPAKAYSFQKLNVEEDTGAIKSANEFVAEIVLANRAGRCEGYSRLFKTLCDYAGIRSEIITGYARGNMSSSSRFVSNHFWNAVFVDSAWHLLDVTWASGSVSFFSDRFIPKFDDYYFFTSPDIFIKDHFPDDLKWTLLSNPPPVEEFRRSPFKPSAYVKYDILSFKPSSGWIETFPGDTIQIELTTTTNQLNKIVATDTARLFESEMLFADSSVVSLQPSTVVEDKKVRYNYVVTSPDVQWLQVMYNNDVVLRYKLRVKKLKATDLISKN
ncbi:MAG: hypothetical protein JST87_12500 [Bacteroidetes bacterium]|nr:hypothetical protein [Bacteroidota bacterium]